MISTSSVTQVLSILTIIGNIFIILFLGYLLLKKSSKVEFIKKNALSFALIIALIATLGSLFYSEIAGYTPCKLCWYQRILMYPQVLLLGIALLRRKASRNIFYYIAPLSLIGAGIAVYHYIIQRISYAASCSADGVSCTSKYVFHFGYITIPIMALTAFILTGILTYIWKKR